MDYFKLTLTEIQYKLHRFHKVPTTISCFIHSIPRSLYIHRKFVFSIVVTRTIYYKKKIVSFMCNNVKINYKL